MTQSITGKCIHIFHMGASNYENNDQIHIKIQHEDQRHLPLKSFLRMLRKFTAENGTKLKDG